jgi:hypothetical protein
MGTGQLKSTQNAVLFCLLITKISYSLKIIKNCTNESQQKSSKNRSSHNVLSLKRQIDHYVGWIQPQKWHSSCFLLHHRNHFEKFSNVFGGHLISPIQEEGSYTYYYSLKVKGACYAFM